MPPLILASTSRYRADLLKRLRLPFSVTAPGVEETVMPGEAPAATALRLALAKANAVARSIPEGIVIGSDQVAHCEGRVLGKPGGREAAIEQLRHMRGRSTRFETALAVIDCASRREEALVVPTLVVLRRLSDSEIAAYVDADEPWDCAGSARSEGMGIALMESIEGTDPTALVGLPLIALATMLRRAGLDPLARS